MEGSQRSVLRRLVLVRAGATDYHAEDRLLGTTDAPLSGAGRAALRERRRHWEWVDGVLSSPLVRARESASILAGNVVVTLLPALGPRSYGHWEGLRPDEIERRDPIGFADWQAGRPVAVPRGESLAAFQTRVRSAVEALLRASHVSPLVVTHGDVIREIVSEWVGEPLPDGRPHPGEMVLASRVHGGKFRLGRRSSDPAPLRSSLEREGLSGVDPGSPERHVAHLEIR